jgi:hypothetical protein
VKGRQEEATLFDFLPGDAEPGETPVNDFGGIPERLAILALRHKGRRMCNWPAF